MLAHPGRSPDLFHGKAQFACAKRAKEATSRARSMPGSGSDRAPALDCFFEERVVCEFQYGLKNKLEEGKLFMQSLFKKIRSSRTRSEERRVGKEWRSRLSPY